MDTVRTGVATAFGLVLVALAADPVAAASTTNELIRGLNEQLVFIAVPITVLVEAILLYAVLKFRNNDEPKPTRENRRLEMTWTIATALILLFVGVSSTLVMADPAVTTPDTAEPGPDDVAVDVEAQTYMFTFTYEGEGVQTRNKLVVPEGKAVYLNITAKDWLHSVHVPALGLKQMAVVGEYNTIKTTPTETGVYQGYCAEYCGQGHSGMLFEVEVVSQAEYEQWLEQQRDESNATANGDD
jgi:cytochrome c oxidase subunit 2